MSLRRMLRVERAPVCFGGVVAEFVRRTAVRVFR